MSISKGLGILERVVYLPLTLIRLSLLGFFFFTGCLSIVFSQFLFLTFYMGEKNGLQKLLNYTKRNFVILLTFCTSMFSSPSKIILSFKSDKLRERCLKVKPDQKGNRRYELNFDLSAVIISNHQIYSDWFFLWFIAYLNNCSDHFFIVMKKSLEKLPVLGYGMSNYNFVFLSRNWQLDKSYMVKQFKTIKLLSNKFWMLIFPEGTNMSHNNRNKSHKFAEENNLPKQDCVLLPRVKGLYVACKELAPATTKIIDFTIGYSDHGKDEMAQDIFTLWKIYIEGESPRKISVLVDEYDLKEEVPGIDLSGTHDIVPADEEEREMELVNSWITDKWQIKEHDMDYFYKHGEFEGGKAHQYELDLKLNSSWEIIYVYLPTLCVVPIIGATWALGKWLLH